MPAELGKRGMPQETWDEVIGKIEDALNQRVANEFTFVKPGFLSLIFMIIFVAAVGVSHLYFGEVEHLDAVKFNATETSSLNTEVSSETHGSEGAVVGSGLAESNFAEAYQEEETADSWILAVGQFVLFPVMIVCVCYDLMINQRKVLILEQALTDLNGEILEKWHSKVYYIKPRKRIARIIVVDSSFDPLASWKEQLGEEGSELLGSGDPNNVNIRLALTQATGIRALQTTGQPGS